MYTYTAGSTACILVPKHSKSLDSSYDINRQYLLTHVVYPTMGYLCA